MFGYTGGTANAAVIRIAVVLLFHIDCVCLPAGRAWASGFFHMLPVEYFSDNKRLVKEQFQKTQKAIDWREPVLTSDGHITFYVPPQPVLSLLEDPTPDNARQYLAWQDEKMEHILKAQEALAAVEQEEARP